MVSVRMKYHPPLYLVACILFAEAASIAAPFDELLPKSGTQGRVMTVAVPERLKELTAQMMESLKKNQEWFLKASKEAPVGAPIPYDERLGISRDEYDEYLKLIKHGSLAEVGAFKLEVLENPDGSRSLDAGASLPPLRGIKFNSNGEVIETPFGTLKGPRERTVDGKGGALGPWKGLVYELAEGTAESLAQTGMGKSISLTIGRQTETGRRFLIYKAMVAENGSRTASFEHIVVFD
jgi:hypothetical protein